MHVHLLLGAAALITAYAHGPERQGTESFDGQGIRKGAQILFLGTAAGPPLRSVRSEPATLLTVDGHQYLIDCGIGTIGRIVQAGIDSKQIKTILFTHLHADHTLGLADLMANDFFERGRAGAADPINIYGPPQTKNLVESAFQFISIGFHPFAAANPAAYRAVGAELVSPFVSHEITAPGVIFKDNEVRVTAAENSHYALIPMPARERFKSYSYRIETSHGVVVFTGDTGPDQTLAQFANGADVLVAEASYRDAADLDQTMAARAARNHLPLKEMKAFKDHFTAEHLDAAAIGKLASQARVKSVILYHYNPTSKADQAAYVQGVKKHFSGPVFAPDDLTRLCISDTGTGRGNSIQPC